MAKLLDCEPVGSLEVIDSSLTVEVTLDDNVTLSEGGTTTPALAATWAAITNQYITGIQFEAGPSDLSSGITLTAANKEALSWVQTSGLLPVKDYTIRYRAIGAAPNTFGPWAGPFTRTSGTGIAADVVPIIPATVTGIPALSVSTSINPDGTEVSYLTTSCEPVDEATGYDVEIDNGVISWTEWSPTNSLKNMAVAAGRDYRTRFKAMSRTGHRSEEWSAWSAVVESGGDTTAPGPVTAPMVTPLARRNVVSWTNPADADFSHVILYRNTTGTAPTGATTPYAPRVQGSIFPDTNVLAGQIYYYWARTVDRSGNVGVTFTPLGNGTPLFYRLVGGGGAAGSDFDPADTDIVTGNGTAALIAGQTRFATSPSISLADSDVAAPWSALDSRPALTQGNSLTEDPAMVDPAAWQLISCGFSGAAPGYWQGALVNNLNQGGFFAGARTVPADRTKTYMLEGFVYANAGGPLSTAYGGVDVQDGNGNIISGDGAYWLYSPTGLQPPLGVNTYYSRVFGAGTGRPLPGNAAVMRVIGFPNYGNVAGAQHYFNNWRIVEVVRIGGNLYRQDGSLATEPQIVTNQGVAALVEGQGYFATQDYADWSTRVTGPTKPADNAGTSGVLTPIGSHSSVRGNTVQKATGTHGAWEGGAVGVAQKGSAFISSSLIQVMNGGGWLTNLALDSDPSSFDYLGEDYVAQYVCTGVGSGEVRLVMNGLHLAWLPVSGLSLSSRMTLAYDGATVSIRIDGKTYQSVAAPAGLRLFPKVLDFYKTILALAPAAVVDIQYGAWTENTATVLSLRDVNSGRIEISGNSAYKTKGGSDWNAGVASQESYVGSAVASARRGLPATGYFPVMFGLTDANAGFVGNYTELDYAWHPTGDPSTDHVQIYESGAWVGTPILAGAWSVDDVFTVAYDGVNVRYLHNGVVKRTVATSPGRQFYFGSAHYTEGTGLRDIKFGPGPEAARIDRIWNTAGTSQYGQGQVVTAEGTAALIAGQGPGATAPANRVLNDRLENGVRTISQPDGATLNVGGGSVSGQIQIVMPFGGSYSMLTFEVLIYNFASGQTSRYIIGGYDYAVGPEWHNVSAHYIGPREFSRPVKFGYYLGRGYIWIGNVSDLWDYSVVSVRNLQVGYSNQNLAWESDWSVTLNQGDISSLVSKTVAIPRAGDAVFGEGILEGPGLGVAARADFRTNLGTAALVAGQTRFATQSVAEYASNAAALAAGHVGKVFYNTTTLVMETCIDTSMVAGTVKQMTSGAGAANVSSTAYSAVGNCYLELSMSLDGGSLDADASWNGTVTLEEYNAGSGWRTVGTASLIVASSGLDLGGGVYQSDGGSAQIAGTGIRTGSVTYRVSIARTSGSNFVAGAVINAILKITPIS